MSTLLRNLLLASAAYDLVALALLWSMPGFLFEFFSHPIPTDAFLFRLAALPLWMMPPLYVMAARAESARALVVRACVVLRVVGGLGIAGLVIVHAPAGAGAYWSFAAGDLVWALLLETARRRAVV